MAATSMAGMSNMASMTKTMDMATASASATMAMSSSDMGSMDMGNGDCKVSMMWNWNTIDACFISSDWHIETPGQFAGTCIGVFVWVVALQGWMRLHREYDRWIVNRWTSRSGGRSDVKSESQAKNMDLTSEMSLGSSSYKKFRISLPQQLLRAAIYSVEFGAGYLLMLMAMYYNGYVLISGFIGAFVGYFLFGYDTVPNGLDPNGQCC